MSNMLKGKLVIKGEKGERGYSAYEIAVQNGFEGSENEWLESLEGKSAYEIALNHGFEGTEEEWVDLLQKHREDYESALEQLKEELANAENGSAYVLKKDIVTVEGYINDNNINVSIEYPDGFNMNNTIILAAYVYQYNLYTSGVLIPYRRLMLEDFWVDLQPNVIEVMYRGENPLGRETKLEFVLAKIA